MHVHMVLLLDMLLFHYKFHRRRLRKSPYDIILLLASDSLHIQIYSRVCIQELDGSMEVISMRSHCFVRVTQCSLKVNIKGRRVAVGCTSES